MTDSELSKQPGLNEFLYPRSRYYGRFSPQNLAFNANLQEFSHRVEYISALEAGGKLSPAQAYLEIRKLWKQLRKSKKELGIGKSNPSSDES